MSFRFRKKTIWLVAGSVLVLAAAYLFLIWVSPLLPTGTILTKTSIDLDTKDDVQDKRDRVQIKKLNLEVPYFVGDDDSTLEKGAWWRKPQNGNPKDGGNFVLSAHRFELGWTPAMTKQKSPFYHLDKLQAGDQIKVFYKGKWYFFRVSKKYEVNQYALYIENKSDKPKLTLYSCSLRGPAAGRYVIEALPE